MGMRMYKTIIIFLICIFHSTISSEVKLTRHRRYIIYPDGDPARVQLIIGMGLPVDLEDISVTVGYVIKMLYHIPQNSTDYSSHMLDSASTVERRAREIQNQLEGSNQLENAGKVLYSEGGKNMIKEEVKQRPEASRWSIYTVLEHMINRNGLHGRSCILRTICEAADTPFTHKSGLLGELLHIFFTPSTSEDPLLRHTDNEYHAAEKLGTDPGTICENLFPECQDSILDMFTEIYF